MNETYCGKSCSECLYREQLNCTECKQGPGRQFYGECEIARCCRNKGHETCQTCGFKQTCGKLLDKHNEPLQRQKNAESELQCQKNIAKRSLVLGKWLWILFWLFIPSGIAAILGNQSFISSFPGIYVTGCILNVVCSMTYGLILIRLSSEEERYRTAGIFALVFAALSIIVMIISNVSQSNSLILLTSVPSIIIKFISEYNEYMAHSTALCGVDNELSDNWEKLWKWYIGLICSVIGAFLLMIVLPIVGMIAMVAAAIGIIIVSIMKLVYLYKTADIFRKYPKEILQ